jgi:uncharacterized membrane protein
VLLDDEVFAVLTAVVIIASVLGVAMVVRDELGGEMFTAIGLLDENCRIGDYPRYAYPNQTLRLCLYIYNHMGKPVYWRVVYKVGDNTTLPTTNTTSPRPAMAEWRGVLDHGLNATRRIEVVVGEPPVNATRVALIFELYTYNTAEGRWEYTGRWVHLYINIRR